MKKTISLLFALAISFCASAQVSRLALYNLWKNRLVPPTPSITVTWASMHNILDDGTAWVSKRNAVGSNTAGIGTTDNRVLNVYTNNTLTAIFDSIGRFGIGPGRPLYDFHIRKSRAGAIQSNVENTNGAGYSLSDVSTDATGGYVGLIAFGSTGGVGSLYDSKTAWCAFNTTVACGIINQLAGPIIFATTTYGPTGEAMRIDKNRNVLIAGAGPTHPVNSGTATALLHIGAPGTSYPPIRLTTGALQTGTNIVAGGIEFLTDNLYLTSTTGPTQRNLVQNNLGFAGGQTIVGGTASGENLTLSSTSNATKGKILFGTSGYDAVNNRLGIGNSAPTVALDVTGAILATSAVTTGNIQTTAGVIFAPSLQTNLVYPQSSTDMVVSTRPSTSTNLIFKSTGTTPTETARMTTEGNTLYSGRIEAFKGSNVASANDLTLGLGNVFHITGATQLNAIIVLNWQAGSEITLIFDSTPTVKNNTAGGAGTAVMLLAGGADFSATANDVLKLVYDGTSWFEVSRSVN